MIGFKQIKDMKGWGWLLEMGLMNGQGISWE